MNAKNYGAYEAPQVEIIEIAVFAVSSVDVNPWRDGGSLGDYDAE